MEKILTIVIPTYNIEKYIEKCLSSFIIEEVLDYIEVLIVNDGSTDNSVEIANKYVNQYPNIFKIINKRNGGHGSTINRGIKEAKGGYFKVVDGDDWVDKSAFIRLIDILRKVNSDVVMSNYYWIDNYTGKKKVEFKEPFFGVEYNTEYKFCDICSDMFLKMHGMTIKTEILSKIPSLDENCFYVDMEYVLFPIPFIKTITFIDEYVYMYRVGLPTQSMNPERMRRNAANYDRVLSRILAYYDQIKLSVIDSRYIVYFNNVIARMLATRIKIYLSFPICDDSKKEMIEFEKNMKHKYLDIYKSVKNKSVLLLRNSKYRLYIIAALCYRAKEIKIK